MLKSVRTIKAVEDEMQALVNEAQGKLGKEAAATLLTSLLHELLKDDRDAGALWIRARTTTFKQFGPMRSDGSWVEIQSRTLQDYRNW